MTTRIIEIKGQMFEVDERELRSIDRYRIGDRVKVLKKASSYATERSVYYGVVVAFDAFDQLPTMTICYMDPGVYNPTLEFLHFNEQSHDVEIAPCLDELVVEKADVLERMYAEIDKKQAEIDDMKRKIAYFNKMFGRYFKGVED